MPEINENLKRELKEEMEEIKGIDRKAKALDILIKYFDISCRIEDISATPYAMNLYIKTHDEYAPGSDTAVALVALDNEERKEDYRFLFKFLAQSKNDNIDAVVEGIRFTPHNIGVKLTKSDDYNVYGSKLSDIQEINRLKDENLELKLIIGEMQHKIFKLHKELDQKD